MKTFKCKICGKTWRGGVISMLSHIFSVCAFTSDDRDSGRDRAKGSSAGGGDGKGGTKNVVEGVLLSELRKYWLDDGRCQWCGLPFNVPNAHKENECPMMEYWVETF